jgi:hypothetical protein
MRRSPELVPLSRDHHVALAQALRLRRATAATVDVAVAGFLAFLVTDGERHFAREERHLLPVLPPPARERLLADHAEIRRRAAALGAAPDAAAAVALGELLAAHVRLEERELFPALERDLPAAHLAALGEALAAG